MSIIVRNMEMPKRCFDCPCCWAVGHFECLLAKKDLRKEHGINIIRPNWCPLVEIPPHGRLIDADFEEMHYTSMTTNPTPDVTEQDKHNSLVIVRALQMAKTIIEAED